jgi:hypothetical protein
MNSVLSQGSEGARVSINRKLQSKMPSSFPMTVSDKVRLDSDRILHSGYTNSIMHNVK